MVKAVIGLSGTLGAGKEVAADYIKKRFNCFYVKLSQVLRNELEKKRKGLDRKLLQDSGDEMRKMYGGHVLAKVSIEYLPRNKELIVLDGIRNPGEIDYLKTNLNSNFFLIAIDSKPETRFERMNKRARKDDPKTWEEFLEMDARDQGDGQPEYGQQTRMCMDKADFKIDNDGTEEEFLAKIDESVKRILNG
jgi:dephospho-CoA kinase